MPVDAINLPGQQETLAEVDRVLAVEAEAALELVGNELRARDRRMLKVGGDGVKDLAAADLIGYRIDRGWVELFDGIRESRQRFGQIGGRNAAVLGG